MEAIAVSGKSSLFALVNWWPLTGEAGEAEALVFSFFLVVLAEFESNARAVSGMYFTCSHLKVTMKIGKNRHVTC